MKRRQSTSDAARVISHLQHALLCSAVRMTQLHASVVYSLLAVQRAAVLKCPGQLLMFTLSLRHVTGTATTPLRSNSVNERATTHVVYGRR